MKQPPENVGRRILEALETRLVVFPALRTKLTNMSPRASKSQVEAIEGDVVAFVTLYGGTAQQDLFARVHLASGGCICGAPEDEVIEVDDRSDSVVQARTRALDLAMKLGFTLTKRIKLASIVSELARNISLYAGRGRVEFEVQTSPRRSLTVRASDNGPGIANIQEILSGNYVSKRGMGLGLQAAKKGSNEFSIETAPGKGTRVTAKFFAD